MLRIMRHGCVIEPREGRKDRQMAGNSGWKWWETSTGVLQVTEIWAEMDRKYQNVDLFFWSLEKMFRVGDKIMGSVGLPETQVSVGLPETQVVFFFFGHIKQTSASQLAIVNQCNSISKPSSNIQSSNITKPIPASNQAVSY